MLDPLDGINRQVSSRILNFVNQGRNCLYNDHMYTDGQVSYFPYCIIPSLMHELLVSSYIITLIINFKFERQIHLREQHLVVYALFLVSSKIILEYLANHLLAIEMLT